MKRIIIINGSARSGKDTFVNYLEEILDTHLFRISSVGAVKNFAKNLLGTNPVKSDEYRKFLSDIKDAWTKYNDGPFYSMTEMIDDYINAFEKSVITVMVREPIEIAKIKEYYGRECTTVLVKRDGIPIPKNHADSMVNDYDYEHYIDNNGTLDDLKDKATTFVLKIINKDGFGGFAGALFAPAPTLAEYIVEEDFDEDFDD